MDYTFNDRGLVPIAFRTLLHLLMLTGGLLIRLIIAVSNNRSIPPLGKFSEILNL